MKYIFFSFIVIFFSGCIHNDKPNIPTNYFECIPYMKENLCNKYFDGLKDANYSLEISLPNILKKIDNKSGISEEKVVNLIHTNYTTCINRNVIDICETKFTKGEK